MGTIAQKLEYLNDTRLLLKENINKINNVLTDNSTFRSYPQELFNGYLDILNNGTDTLWNNLEKVSASGEEATLENVETAPIKMVLNGNTSQETTTGKNLLGLTNGTYSHNGITAVVNDGTITITGTATANSFVNIPLIKDIVLSNEQVTASINNATTISDTATEFRVYESSYNYIPVQFTTIDGKIITTKSGTFVSAYVRTTSGVNYGSGLVIKPQLELGSTATSWEKYTGGQPSPSPDFPQQVKVVKGENVVSVQGKNLFDKSSNIVLNKYIGEDGTISGNSPRNWYQEDYIEVSNSTDYIISTTSSNYVRVAFYDDSKNFISRIVANGGIQISTTSSTKYLRLSGYDNLNDNIQLELGSATPYVPYSKTDYPINLGDIELCKINTYKDYFHKDSGKWYVHKEINKVVLDGSENWSERTNAINVKQFYVGNTIPAVKNITQYCNYFAKYNQSLYNYGGIGDFAILTNSRQFFGCVNSDLTLENFKTLLASNNLIVYYVLATPTETEITNSTLIEQLEAISNAKSVKDKTYITQTNDELPFILDVEAVKEYEVN